MVLGKDQVAVGRDRIEQGRDRLDHLNGGVEPEDQVIPAVRRFLETEWLERAGAFRVSRTPGRIVFFPGQEIVLRPGGDERGTEAIHCRTKITDHRGVTRRWNFIYAQRYDATAGFHRSEAVANFVSRASTKDSRV